MRALYSLAALVVTTLLSSVAHTEQKTFYSRQTDPFWSVTGANDTSTGQADCFAEADRKDGSTIQIHRSLVTGELWAVIHGIEWDIQSKNGTLRWNFYGPGSKGDLIAGTDFHYEVSDKNTVLVLNITPNAFSEAFWNSTFFAIIMPGNLSNLRFDFESKGNTMLSALAECIKKNEKTFKDTRQPLEKIPDSIKEQL
jgi:hypothetical protein